MSKPKTPKTETKESRKEAIARIAAENRAYFEELDAPPKQQSRKEPIADTALENHASFRTLKATNEEPAALYICPHCRNECSLASDLIGCDVTCPHCQNVFSAVACFPANSTIKSSAANVEQRREAPTQSRQTTSGGVWEGLRWILTIALFVGFGMKGYLLLTATKDIANRESKPLWKKLIPAAFTKVNIDGKVYVTTKGADVIYMPNIPVYYFEEASMTELVNRCNQTLGTKRQAFTTQYQSAKALDKYSEATVKAGNEVKASYATYIAAEQSKNQNEIINARDAYNAAVALHNARYSAEAEKRISLLLPASGKVRSSANIFSEWDGFVRDTVAMTIFADFTVHKVVQQLENSGKTKSVRKSRTMQQTQTDAEGIFHFTTELTDNSVGYAFVAFGERQIVGSTERYCWFRRFTQFKSSGTYDLVLNNENEMRAERRALYGDDLSDFNDKYHPTDETEFWIQILTGNYGLKSRLED